MPVMFLMHDTVVDRTDENFCAEIFNFVTVDDFFFLTTVSVCPSVSYNQNWSYWSTVGPVAQSVQRLTTGWTVRDRIPVGTRFSACPDRPWAHPASCKIGTECFPGETCGLGVLLTTHSLLVPRSWNSRAIPLPTLWATPGLKRDYFTFFTYWTTSKFARRTNSIGFEGFIRKLHRQIKTAFPIIFPLPEPLEMILHIPHNTYLRKR